MAAAHTQRSLVIGVRGDLPPSPAAHISVGWARERQNLAATVLLPNVIPTIQGSRVRSTRDAYDGKWRAFEEWRVKAGAVTFQISAAVILYDSLSSNIDLFYLLGRMLIRMWRLNKILSLPCTGT